MCVCQGFGQNTGAAGWAFLALSLGSWGGPLLVFADVPRPCIWQGGGRWRFPLGGAYMGGWGPWLGGFGAHPPAHPQGLFDNFLRLRLRDSSLGAVCAALDWLAFDDLLSRAAHHGQSFRLLRYLPFLPAAFHLLFASSHVPRIAFPSSQQEVCPCTQPGARGRPRDAGLPRPHSLSAPGPEPDKQDTEPHPDAGVGPDARYPQPGCTSGPRPGCPLPASGHPCAQAAPCECLSQGGVATAHRGGPLAMLSVRALAPASCPQVSTQLYSTREKQQLAGLVGTMLAYSLTYRQERMPDGHYVYRLEP